MNKDKKWTADEIVKLLVENHADCLCVPECKNGPTQSVSNYSRLDLWVLRRTWSRPSAIGYEVKVSRSDFLRDDKWQNYLPMCQELYFVCPWKLIDPSEISEQCGLKWISPAGKIHTKRKAKYREQEFDLPTLLYVLICRSTIQDEAMIAARRTRESKVEFWRRWLEERQVDYELGHRVRGVLAETIEQKILDVGYKQEKLDERIKDLEHIQQIASDAGIKSWDRDGDMIRKITNHLAGNLKAAEEVEQIARSLQRSADELRGMSKETVQ